MVCPFCSSETDVVNSRPQKRTNGIWRRRACSSCNRVFTSVEKPDLSGLIRIKKRSEALEPLSEAKLISSLYKSLDHQKNAMQVALELSQTIILAVVRDINAAIVPSEAIATHAIIVLKRFDAVAAVRYQSFRSPLTSKREIRRAIS